MVRERLSGQMDRFRVAPVSSMELLVGKYLAYAVLSLIVAGVVGALLVLVLNVHCSAERRSSQASCCC